MAYGSMAPGFMNMAAPPVAAQPSVGSQSQALIAALLKAKPQLQGMLGGGAAAAPDPAAPLSLTAPGNGPTAPNFINSGLLSKIFPEAMGAIDPKTGMPMAPAMPGGVNLPDMGGAGPAPNALSGLW